jgi:hypothetical protein
MKSLSFLITAIIASVALTCKDSSTGPQIPADPDTSSHAFTWTQFTLGDGATNRFNDVAILDDTTIWAVGEIYFRDSTGQIAEPGYNLAIFNGSSWRYEKIPMRDFGGLSYVTPIPSIFAFAKNDVWLGGLADLVHYDGQSYVSKAFFGTTLPFTGQVRRVWGTDGNNLYCVGNTGSIYHYYGTGWQKLSCPTTLNVVDIWGAWNPY